MATDKNTIWSFCEEFPLESPEIQAAREVALELGVDPVSPSTGALLRAVARLRNAKSAVEIGTGTGVSGLWILAGMASGGVLTTIDPESEFQREAARAFRQAQVPSPRTRFINGRALDVLPRLAADSYDMVVLDGLPEETYAYVEHANRILKSGGAVVIPNGLWFGNVADPARRDPHTVAMREVCKELEESDSFDLAMLAVGDGVLLATKR
ncbi:O-methyltransferase [Actinomycetaceae bacterium MB13-C1-2]|nr:O-methyltransferase [Actinomycetaceae bacterium MB13-C1-2]